MPRLAWVCVALLASLLTTPAPAQSGDPLLPSHRPADDRPPGNVLWGNPWQYQPVLRPADPGVMWQTPSGQDSTAPGDVLPSDQPNLEVPASEMSVDCDAVGETTEDSEASDEVVCFKSLDEFFGYRCGENSLDWIFGGGDQFGMFSIASNHYQSPGENSGLSAGLHFHFLDGPERAEMPPRVFDFSLAFQSRKQMGDFSYDVAGSVMASSDFEGSSREGIRFPSHAVGYLRVNPTTELVFGIDYLDRGDLKLLPVGGLIVVPHPNVRLEIVFPRPRAVFRLTDKHRLFVRGELGGGTWAVERYRTVDDLASYRDLRLGIGVETLGSKGHRSIIEIAYLFSRRLEFTSGDGDYAPDDTAMIRLAGVF